MVELLSNNSFNRSANSVAFMRETCIISAVRRARLIRALDCFVDLAYENFWILEANYSIACRDASCPTLGHCFCGCWSRGLYLGEDSLSLYDALDLPLSINHCSIHSACDSSVPALWLDLGFCQ